MNHPTLYSRNTDGSVQIWWIEQLKDAYRQCYGKKDGKIVVKKWTYAEPKNLGRSNQTSPEEQANLEIKAQYEKQLRTNYFESIDDIDSGFLEPQLAKPCKDYLDKIDWSLGQVVDHKLNGIACIIRLINNEVVAISRTNKRFYSIPHITDSLKPFFQKNPNAYLQGELFNPEYVTQLNVIAEAVTVTREEKDITEEVLKNSAAIAQYHIYDGYNINNITISDSTTKRKEIINKTLKNKYNHIFTTEYKVCYSFDQMNTYAYDYIKKGGEGVIIRNPEAPYQHKRTKDLLKYKKMESEEFKIVSFEEGSADWKGCAKAVYCELPDKRTFKSNIRGTQETLRQVLKEQDKYIGKNITVDFQEYSPYGVPLIPYTSLIIRNYE